MGFDHDLPDILSGPSVAEPLWDLSGRRHRASEAAGMLASVGVRVVPSSGVPTFPSSAAVLDLFAVSGHWSAVEFMSCTVPLTPFPHVGDHRSVQLCIPAVWGQKPID